MGTSSSISQHELDLMEGYISLVCQNRGYSSILCAINEARRGDRSNLELYLSGAKKDSFIKEFAKLKEEARHRAQTEPTCIAEKETRDEGKKHPPEEETLLSPQRFDGMRRRHP